jgi:hypothetical protein
VEGFPWSCNFLLYHVGQRVRLPIYFTNIDDCPEMKRLAHLIIVSQFIECICEGEIPDRIRVDLRTLHIGSIVRLKDIKKLLPKHVRVCKTVNKEFVAGVIKLLK